MVRLEFNNMSKTEIELMFNAPLQPQNSRNFFHTRLLLSIFILWMLCCCCWWFFLSKFVFILPNIVQTSLISAARFIRFFFIVKHWYYSHIVSEKNRNKVHRYNIFFNNFNDCLWMFMKSKRMKHKIFFRFP